MAITGTNNLADTLSFCQDTTTHLKIQLILPTGGLLGSIFQDVVDNKLSSVSKIAC